MKSVIKNLLQDIGNQIYENGYCYAEIEFPDECYILVESDKDNILFEYWDANNKKHYSDKYPNITDWIINEITVFDAEWEAKQDKECSVCDKPISSGYYCSTSCYETSMR